MFTITDEQWEKIEQQAKDHAEDVIKYLDTEDLAKGEIHEQGGAGFEQREYLASYLIFESHMSDIIEEVTEQEDGREAEGYHDFIQEMLDWITEQLEGAWYIYCEDSDMWIARHWDNREDVPEELQNLIYEY